MPGGIETGSQTPEAYKSTDCTGLFGSGAVHRLCAWRTVRPCGQVSSASMPLSEPANLREWSPACGIGSGGRLFTCGRPGRAIFGRLRCRVDEGTIDLW